MRAAIEALILLGPMAVAGHAAQTVGTEPATAAIAAEPSAGDRLQQMQQAQAAALAAGDAARILEASRELAAVAARLLGDLSREQGRAAEATTRYRQSLALVPAPEVQHTLLTAEVAAGERANALALGEQIVGSAGDGAPLRMQLAAAFHMGGDLNGTIAELERATAIAPGFAGAHLALGTAFWELNEFQYNGDSLREFTEAQRLAPDDYFASFDLGSVLSQYGRYAEAAPYLERAAREDASSPDPFLVLGMNAWAEQRTAAARTALERAVALTGAQEARNNYQVRRAYAVLSRLSTEQGRTTVAADFAARADALQRKATASGQVGAITESTGMTATIAPSAAAGTGNEGPQATASHAALERELEGVLARSLNDAGTVLARQREYAGALPFFRQAAAADATLASASRNQGLAAFHVGAWAEAVDALERALALTPGDALVERDLEQARANAATAVPAGAP